MATCFYSSGTFTRPESQGDRGHGPWARLGQRVALLGVVPTTGTSGTAIWYLEWDQHENQDKGGFWAPMCPWTWVLISARSCANAQSSLPITVWILKQQLRALEKNERMLPY